MVCPVTLNESVDAGDADAQKTIWLDLTCHDKPGIMREVSNVFVAQGVSVQSLDTEVVSASMSGGDMFVAGAQLLVSKDFDMESLQQVMADSPSLRKLATVVKLAKPPINKARLTSALVMR